MYHLSEQKPEPGLARSALLENVGKAFIVERDRMLCHATKDEDSTDRLEANATGHAA